MINSLAEYVNYLNEQNKTQLMPQTLYEQLRDRILEGVYPDGARLMEKDISYEFGVSRTPVREAFRKLELDGLLKVIPNKGAFVVAVDDRTILDMYSIRAACERLAVEWAIERMTPQQLKELKEIYDFMEFYTQRHDPEKVLLVNTAFHKIIYDMADNNKLRDILVSYQIYSIHGRVSAYNVARDEHEVLEEHRAIYEAIMNRDKEAAVKAMDVHMHNTMLFATGKAGGSSGIISGRTDY